MHSHFPSNLNSISILNEENKQQSKAEKNVHVKKEYEKLNKPFIVQTIPITENPSEYKCFLSLFKTSISHRPKRMNKHNLIVEIEKIYTAKFIEESNNFKSNAFSFDESEYNKSTVNFPHYVFQYFTNLLKHPKLVIQVF